MSLNKLTYDDCAYTHKLRESISPGDYMLQTPKPCKPCFIATPGVNIGGFGASLCENLIDVDSEMMNITRKASDCPSKKYLPGIMEKTCGTLNNPIECSEDNNVSMFLTREDTLISNPKCTNKERTINRWEWLCRDPRERAIIPFDRLIANRLVVKDAHRPLKPALIDQTSALPKQIPSKCSSYFDEQFVEARVEINKEIPTFPLTQWKYDNVQFANCGNF